MNFLKNVFTLCFSYLKYKHVLAWAAIIKFNTRRLTEEKYFLTILEAGKFKIQVPTAWVSAESSLLGQQKTASLLCAHMAFL